MATKDEAFPSKYLKAADIGEQTPIVTISQVVREELKSDRGTEWKYVAYFKGIDKGLVLNRTNWDMLEYLTKKTDSDDWIGAKIMVVVEDVPMRGEIKPALRIKRPTPQNGPRQTVVSKDKGGFRTSSTVPQEDPPFDDELPEGFR